VVVVGTTPKMLAVMQITPICVVVALAIFLVMAIIAFLLNLILV
jgi:hypothetical protein